MSRARRIFAVTAGLFATGAIVGAITGALVMAAIAWFVTRSVPPFAPEVLAIGATAGASLGAVLFPAAGWLLMRHVPLGKALLGTSISTLAGGLVGWFLPIGLNYPLTRTLTFGVFGFAIAVMLLRRSASASQPKAGGGEA